MIDFVMTLEKLHCIVYKIGITIAFFVCDGQRSCHIHFTSGATNETFYQQFCKKICSIKLDDEVISKYWKMKQNIDEIANKYCFSMERFPTRPYKRVGCTWKWPLGANLYTQIQCLWYFVSHALKFYLPYCETCARVH